jgi:hypothetical protein
MIPAFFEFDVAESIDHAVKLLGRYGEDARGDSAFFRYG